MNRWLRKVMPSEWLVGLILLYVFCLALERLREWRLSESPDGRLHLATLVLAACCYAVYRVWAFHPALRPQYYEWLAGTPWTSQRPLPLGPIHLVAQDAVIVGAAFLLAWPHAGPPAFIIVQHFLFWYLLTLGVGLWSAGEKSYTYVLTLGLGLMVHVSSNLAVYFAAALAVYGFGWLSLRGSLARFPWQFSRIQQLSKSIKEGQLGKDGRKGLGWPFSQLGPKVTEDWARFPWRKAAYTSVLVGWLYYTLVPFFAGALRSKDGQGLPVDVFYYEALWIIFLLRLWIYVKCYMPPIGFWGRMCTGRWIIPEYDKIFIAPCLAGAAVWGLLRLGALAGLEEIVSQSVALAVFLFIILGMGPTLEAWRLTGNNRITYWQPNSEYVKVG